MDSVNAYVVFAHAPPVEEGQASTTTVMDPYEAAKVAIKEADGSVFNGHSLRVDTAVRGKGKGKAGDVGAVEIAEDPKATVFVGNLDFACKEEDVRAFFEKVMVEERGAPGESKGSGSDDEEDKDGEDEEAEEKTKHGEKVSAGAVLRTAWVKRVRIIRDKDTLLGKGFGYVQFAVRFHSLYSFVTHTHMRSFTGPELRRRNPRTRRVPSQIRQTQAPRPTLQDPPRRLQTRQALSLQQTLTIINKTRQTGPQPPIHYRARRRTERRSNPRDEDRESVEGGPEEGQVFRRRSRGEAVGEEEGEGVG